LIHTAYLITPNLICFGCDQKGDWVLVFIFSREFQFQYGASWTSDKFNENDIIKSKTAKTNVKKHITTHNCNEKKTLANLNEYFEHDADLPTKERSSSFVQKA
jgi:hypothetical protein